MEKGGYVKKKDEKNAKILISRFFLILSAVFMEAFMTLDIVFAVFIALAMLAGGIGGGFKEILKLIVFVTLFCVFKIPSLEAALQELVPPQFYTTFFIAAFLLSYFVSYKLLFFALRDLIKDKEGTLGKTNRILGVGVGFFKGLAVVFVIVYILDSLMNHNILTELKPLSADSVVFSVIKIVLDATKDFFV